MEKRITIATLILLAAAPAIGQYPYGIKLNPGERLIAIDGKPVTGQQSAVATVHETAKPASAPAQQTHEVRKPVVDHVTNIVGNLVRSNLPFSHSDGDTALEKANTERARNRQSALIPDPELQALALRKAKIAAARSYKNHIGGSLGSAKCEGVGHTNGRFLTCCLDEPGTYGGAAMVQGRDGWYCCLLVR